MGTIKGRNGMDLTEGEDINRGGKNTQKNYTKKDLYDPDNHKGSQTSWNAKSSGPQEASL